jgi:hypothetical protein
MPQELFLSSASVYLAERSVERARAAQWCRVYTVQDIWNSVAGRNWGNKLYTDTLNTGGFNVYQQHVDRDRESEV